MSGKQVLRTSLAVSKRKTSVAESRQARVEHAFLARGTAAAVALALLFSLTSCLGAERAQSAVQAALSSCGDQSYPYVCAQGRDLVYQGRRLRLVGGTLYPAIVLGGHTMRGAAWASNKSAFHAYIDHWLNVAHAAGLNTIRPTDYLAHGRDWHDGTVWQNLDYLIAGARARGMFVIMDLSPFRNSMRDSGRFPYNASAWNQFLDFVGSRYSGEQAIAYYSIAGEIEPPNGKDPTRATAAQYVAFFRHTIVRLHAADGGHHLVATGGFNHLQRGYGIPWQTLFGLPGADLATVHIYSDSDRQNVLPAVGAWSAHQLKPLIVEEFGFKQEIGDTDRAQAFRYTYELAQGYKAAGMVFWNLGPEMSPGSYDVSPTTPDVWTVIRDVVAGRHQISHKSENAQNFDEQH